MNLQEVNNITITEGTVRTIHDINNRLLWGRLNYDTKYAGDTLQDGTPTPETPIPVQVATGTQTVTIGDGVSSEAFTISLGSIELCKIGNYQDYIYKSGNDWYVYKEIGKAVLNGSEAWTVHSQIHNNIYGFRLDIGTIPSNGAGVKSDNFYAVPWTTYQGDGVDGRSYGMITTLQSSGSYMYISQPNASVITLSDFTSWLGSHNTTVYYALATTTNTQITDATLIGQLNSIHQFLTRYGYSSTVSGNLPIIIEQTNL